MTVSLLLYMLSLEFTVPKNNVIRIASRVFLKQFLVLSFVSGENNEFSFPYVAACIEVWNRGKS